MRKLRTDSTGLTLFWSKLRLSLYFSIFNSLIIEACAAVFASVWASSNDQTQHDPLLADFDKALELNPNSAKIHNNRGELKRAMGNLDGALADYDKAIELQPDLAKNEISRHLIKKLKGKSKTAETPMTTSRKTIPKTENSLALRTDFSDEAASGNHSAPPFKTRTQISQRMWISSATGATKG